VIGLQETPRICIFRLSKKMEFPGGTDQVIGWLRNGKYHFREKAPTALPRGSIILFSIEGKVVAEAVTKGGVRETTPEEREECKRRYGYEYLRAVEFSTGSVRIFPEPVSDIEKLIGKKLAQLFTYIEPPEYFSIIKNVYAR